MRGERSGAGAAGGGCSRRGGGSGGRAVSPRRAAASRALAARPTSAAARACVITALPPRRASPGSGEGPGRAEDLAGLAAPQLFPLMAAMMPLTLCAPGRPHPPALGRRSAGAEVPSSLGLPGAAQKHLLFFSPSRCRRCRPAGQCGCRIAAEQGGGGAGAPPGGGSWGWGRGPAAGEAAVGDERSRPRAARLNQLVTALATWTPGCLFTRFLAQQPPSSQAGTLPPQLASGRGRNSPKSGIERIFQKEKPVGRSPLLFILKIHTPPPPPPVCFWKGGGGEVLGITKVCIARLALFICFSFA